MSRENLIFVNSNTWNGSIEFSQQISYKISIRRPVFYSEQLKNSSCFVCHPYGFLESRARPSSQGSFPRSPCGQILLTSWGNGSLSDYFTSVLEIPGNSGRHFWTITVVPWKRFRLPTSSYGKNTFSLQECHHGLYTSCFEGVFLVDFGTAFGLRSHGSFQNINATIDPVCQSPFAVLLYHSCESLGVLFAARNL